MSVFFLSSFLIAHSFGRRMLYPGSVGLLQKAMRPMLQQGQARLIEEVKKKKKESKKLTVTLCLYSILSTDHHSLSFSAPFLSQFDGQRNKLVACDGNEIDTMFVDRRRDGGQKSQTLVNVCNDLLFLKPWASFRVQQNLSHQSLFIWVSKCMNSATGHLL